MKIFRSIPAVWTGWICFRLILIGLLQWNNVPLGDISYYFSGRFGANSSDMTEYPHPGTWPSILVGWLSGPNQTSFTVIFTGLCLLVDAAFLMVLLHGWRRKPQAFVAAWFWVVFGTAVGQVFVWRLDIFPALAVAAAGVLLGRNSRLAAALLGLATTMKLWPGVLAAGLVGRFNARATWQRLSAFVASIVGICLLVIAFNDVERLISPLRYQEVRGLQVESIPATLPVFASHLFPDTWSIGYAASKSYEITGPWVSELLVLSNVLTLAMLFFALGFALMHFRNGNWGARSTLAFFITMICLLFISNKVFSTQYITWLGPILAVALKDAWPHASSVAHQHIDEKVGTVLRNLALCTLAAAALGTLVYPFNYDALLYAGRGGLFPAFLLLARNVLILVMTGLAFSWLRLELKRENTSSTKQAAQ
ncbi:DUF2029 domain-containing protein [Corynebacterium striatum]